jgi:nucleotide-binding universal stress UspA family protein
LIDNVLVPHDLTASSDPGLHALRPLGASIGQVHVLHVLRRVDPGFPGVVWPTEEDEARKAHARRAIHDRLASAGLERVRVHLAFGDPATRILDLANDIGAGLVVMASHSRSGLLRVALGSVAERVARFATCPVLIVPAQVVTANRRRAVPAYARTPEEQVDALGAEITDAVAKHAGYLTAVRIGVPAGLPPRWWQTRLEGRLSEAGLVFVDLVVDPAPLGAAEILELRFEDRFAE